MTRPALGDRELKNTRALPSGASAVKGAALDFGAFSSRADFVAETELLLSVPAVTTGMLADSATIKYDIITDDDSAFGSPTVLLSTVLTQTGAGGAGAAANTWQGRLPITGLKRYIGVQATKSASGDASSKEATLEALF